MARRLSPPPFTSMFHRSSHCVHFKSSVSGFKMKTTKLWKMCFAKNFLCCAMALPSMFASVLRCVHTGTKNLAFANDATSFHHLQLKSLPCAIRKLVRPKTLKVGNVCAQMRLCHFLWRNKAFNLRVRKQKRRKARKDNFLWDFLLIRHKLDQMNRWRRATNRTHPCRAGQNGRSKLQTGWQV